MASGSGGGPPLAPIAPTTTSSGPVGGGRAPYNEPIASVETKFCQKLLEVAHPPVAVGPDEAGMHKGSGVEFGAEGRAIFNPRVSIHLNGFPLTY